MFVNIVFNHDYLMIFRVLKSIITLFVGALLPLSPSCSRMISFCPVNIIHIGLHSRYFGF